MKRREEMRDFPSSRGRIVNKWWMHEAKGILGLVNFAKVSPLYLTKFLATLGRKGARNLHIAIGFRATGGRGARREHPAAPAWKSTAAATAVFM